jgi:SAM-dependent methyltransferase
VTIERDDLYDRIRRFWDADAAVYDRSVGHGIEHLAAAGAWRAALARHLPPAPARVLDVGAGTGAMALLAAELGYEVTALDLSPGMLAHGERKAVERGLELRTVVGPADQPPEGPFDAVIERHLLWTLPDPVETLARWHDVTEPGGRLVLYEGRWGAKGLGHSVRLRARDAVRRVSRTASEHHGEYDPETIAALPMAGGIDVDVIVEATVLGGWRAARLERLRDVEWAYRAASPPVLGWLESVPRFAVIAQR